MEKVLIYTFIAALAIFSFGNLQAEDELPSTYTVSLSQDPAFGFYPSVNAAIPLSNTTALTFYGIFWTSAATASHSTSADIGLNLMTEFGVGMNFTMMDGALNINPSIGFGNGLYQSGSARPVVADNIVPNVYASYVSGNFSLSFGGVAWMAMRKEGPVQIDMYDYNISPMVAVHKNIAVGLYLDHYLYTTKQTVKGKDESETATGYFWLGPCIKLNVAKSATVSFMAGLDLVDQFNDNLADDDKIIKDFYKLTTSISF